MTYEAHDRIQTGSFDLREPDLEIPIATSLGTAAVSANAPEDLSRTAGFHWERRLTRDLARLRRRRESTLGVASKTTANGSTTRPFLVTP